MIQPKPATPLRQAETPARRGLSRLRRGFLLHAGGFWAILIASAALVACLPWLWWNGGILELTVVRYYIQPAGEVGYQIGLKRLLGQSVQGWKSPQEDRHNAFFFRINADRDGEPHSTLELYEDGRPLGPAHSTNNAIRDVGQGRFVHLPGTLLFSASDNSDPRKNGRVYTIRAISQPRWQPAKVFAAAITWLSALALLVLATRRWRNIFAWGRPYFTGGKQALLASFLITAFTVFVFFFATLQRQFPLRWLLFFATASALFLLISRQRLVFQRWMTWPAAFLAYAVGAAGGISTANLHATVGQDLVLTSALGIPVISAMHRALTTPRGFTVHWIWALCLFFALALVAQNFALDLKSLTNLLDDSRTLPWTYGTWNRKFQGTWLLVLTWIVVAALAPRTRERWWAAGAILAVSSLAIFSGYSGSARMALVGGVAVFAIALKAPRYTGKCLALMAIVLFLLMPVLTKPVWDYFIERSSYLESENGPGEHLTERLVVWEYARQLIHERPWFGRGLGASKRLPGQRRDETAAEYLAGGAALPEVLAKLRPIPGGHPHSLPLLIWLEMGLIGVAIAAGTLWTLFRQIDRVPNPARRSALLALTASTLAIFGLSYPAWDPTLQLLLIMMVSLVNSMIPVQGGYRNG